jgi:hypothetical protein
VLGVVLEFEGEGEFGGDELGGAEFEAEAVKKAAKEKQEWLEGLDRVLEGHGGGEGLRRRDEVERAGFAAVGALPEGEAGAAEAEDDFVAGEGGEIAEGDEAPAVEDGSEFGRGIGGRERERTEEGGRVEDAQDAGGVRGVSGGGDRGGIERRVVGVEGRCGGGGGSGSGDRGGCE